MLGLLGIARRAGRVAVGTRSVTAAGRRGRLALLVVAGDASESAVARLGPEARGAKRITVESRAALGHALGRSEVAVAGVTDAALAARMVAEAAAPEGREKNSGDRGHPERRVP